MTTLVTGGGSGIGRAIALELGRRGHRVAVADLSLKAAETTAAAVDGAIALPVDVTDLASVERACDEAVAALGPLRAWVSNAGVSSMARFVDLTQDEVDLNFDVNARGPLLCGQVAARRFIAQGEGGSIVNIASMAGKQGRVPYLAHYVASKFAVVGLTQAMAFELAASGIRVNSVCPGFVATPMQTRELDWEARLRGSTADAVRAAWIADTPLGRLEQPEDVATVVAFLLSEDAAFITGEAIAVNGGAYMD
jgi:meso-butanediol dehydrogenase / (S,S)-butanediol dehydrogenase / diacetyl reductase